MQWSTEPFIAAYDAIQEPGISAAEAAKLLEDLAEDLQQLFAAPAKSDASRQALGKQVVDFDGTEYRLSVDFVNSAAQVSDEINLDELVAAKLVHYTYKHAQRRAVSPVDAALTGYYTRRQYIVAILTFLIERFGPQEPVKKLLGPTPFAGVLAALRAVEARLVDLDEKTKRGEFMGLDMNLRFVQTLRVQRDFLVQEHQALGVLAARLVAANLASVDEILRMLTHMATFTSYSTRMLAYFAAVSTYFAALDPYIDAARSSSPLTDADAGRVFAALTGDAASHAWKLKWWHGAVRLAFVVYYAGFITTSDRSRHTYVEVLGASRDAINSGGIEALMAFASDLNTSPSAGLAIGNDFTPVVRARVPAVSAWANTVLPELSSLLFAALELVVEAFTANLADVLKEMRLNEEDMYLAQTNAGAAPPEAFAPSQQLLQVMPEGRLRMRARESSEVKVPRPEKGAVHAGPGRDLERFFLFVAYTYRYRPEAGLKFWTDKQNSLHGFLIWASQCQVAFMAATFAELLAAVATGPESAAHCHAFLQQPIKSNTNVFVLRWQSMHDLFVHYALEMDPTAKREEGESTNDKNPSATDNITGNSDNSASNVTRNSSTTGTKPDSETLRPLDEDTLMVALAYLALVRQVVSDCSDAAETTSKPPQSIVDQIFKLLRFQTPMVASLLAALAGYAVHIDVGRLGAALDEWAFAATIRLPGIILSPLPTLPPRFDLLLRSVPDVVAFTALIRAMVARGLKTTDVTVASQPTLVGVSVPTVTSPNRPGRLNDYTQFILGEVLVTAGSDKLGKNDRVVLLESALSLAHDLGADARPWLSKPPVYTTLFGVVATGLEEIVDLPNSHLLVRAVVMAMRVVIDLLTAGVVEPLLFNLQTVPTVALYMGSLHYEIARVSTQLFSLLRTAPEFLAGGGRSDRVLSILQSASDSDRIRFGLIDQLRREDSPTDLKLAILELLVDYLATESDTKGTVAHQLLGFRVHALGHLALDTAPGGIASGASLLDTVCALLGGSVADVAVYDSLDPADCAIAARTSHIVAHLCRDPLSSKLVLEHLRGSEFLLNLLDIEPTLNASDNITEQALADFFVHRANLLDMLAHEVHQVGQAKLLSLLSRYQHVLMYLATPGKSALRLLDFFKFDAAPAAQLQCLQSWCQLVPVLVNTPGDHLTFVLETIQTLVPKLAEYGRRDPEFARPLASLLVLLLEQYRTNVGKEDVSFDRLHPLFQAAVLAAQTAGSVPDLRADTYVICYQIIKMALAQGDAQAVARKLSVVQTAGARLIFVVSSDALGFDERLRLVALIFLYDLAALARRVDSSFIEQALVRYNIVSLLIQTIPPLDAALARAGPSAAADVSALKVTLALLLQLAQTRYSADFILGSGLFDVLDHSLLLKPSASGQPHPHNDVLLVVFQLLAAVLVAMGADNKEVIGQARQLLEKHQHLLLVVLRADAESHGHGSLAELADVVVLLLSLTGFVPAGVTPGALPAALAV